MKLGTKKLEAIEILVNKFKPHGNYSTGYGLDTITKSIADLLGNTKIRINVPYSDFNCSGTASKIAKDVKGLMPFTDARINFSQVTTLFYGDTHVKQSNYLPFLSDVDCFYIKNIDTTSVGYIIINLEKGPSWRSFL